MRISAKTYVFLGGNFFYNYVKIAQTRLVKPRNLEYNQGHIQMAGIFVPPAVERRTEPSKIELGGTPNMRKWNKLLAMVLAMVMVFGLAATSFAEDETKDEETAPVTDTENTGDEDKTEAEG